jgi:hypothetical protein
MSVSTPSGKVRVWRPVLVFVAVAAVAGPVGYNAARNAQARRSATEGCAAARAALGAVLTAQSAKLLFEGDAPAVSADLRANIDDGCAFLDERLVWWRWNAGVQVSLPRDVAREARMNQAVEAARVRCPGTVRALFAELKVEGAAVEEAVTKLCGGLGSLAPSQMAPASPWELAERYGAIAKAQAK